MKKILYLIIILLTISGCTARYQLKINEDLTVEEVIVGLEDDSFYDNYYNSKKSRVVDFVMATKIDYLKSENYKIEKKYEDLLYGATVSKTYNSLDEYSKNSIAYKQLYNSLVINKDNDIIEISLSEKLPKNGQSNDRYVIDEGKIEIIVPFKVVEHNADEYDKDTNKYIWNVNSSNDKNIYIKFDSSKKDNKNNYDIIFVIGLGFIIILAGYIVVKKYQTSQSEKDKI